MKILDFDSYLALNEQEAFYVKLPDLAKNTSSFRTELLKAIQEAGLTTEIFKSGLNELKTGKLRGQLGKDSVKVLQMLLGLKTDGAYGPATKQAVKNFQNTVLKFGESDENKAKRPDGIWGPETAKASFGDESKPGPFFALSKINTKPTSETDLAVEAAKEILIAMTGNTEDEETVYNIFKTKVKTKNTYDKLEKIWNSFNVNVSALRVAPDFYKNKKVEEIQNANKNMKEPMTLSQMFNKYFNTEEINRLNSYLPTGVEKF